MSHLAEAPAATDAYRSSGIGEKVDGCLEPQISGQSLNAQTLGSTPNDFHQLCITAGQGDGGLRT